MALDTTQSRQSFIASVTKWWYRATSPKELPSDAPFQQREKVRRARTASWILLVVIILVLSPLPGALGQHQLNIVGTLLVVTAIDCIALFILNKRGNLVAAGLIIVATIEAGLLGTIFSLKGGMSAVNLPLFDLLAQSEIVAVAMFAPGWVFVMMLVNILLIFFVLHSGALSPDLLSLMSQQGLIIFTQAAEIQVIIAVFAFILVRSADIAILHLDRAEKIAELERREIERQRVVEEEKQRLDLAIEQILSALQSASNGNYAVRVPVSENNVLFRVAYALNTLFQRMSSFRQQQAQLQQAQQAQMENYNLRMQLQEEMRNRQELARQYEKLQQATVQLVENLKAGTLPRRKSDTPIDAIVEQLVSRSDNEISSRYLRE
jgi:hypothetical protein